MRKASAAQQAMNHEMKMLEENENAKKSENRKAMA
jgi:hypothetical protein